MAGRWACIGAGYWPDLRSSRIREDTRSASRAAGLFLPKLALPADLFPIFDAIRRSSLRAGVPHLEPRDAPRLLASPFGAWNLFAGQSGFLTASLLGAALLLLERQPVLAGGFIACLTFK